jgi:FSR family fosmidomycin resistance protein-like MFS transporter
MKTPISPPGGPEKPTPRTNQTQHRFSKGELGSLAFAHFMVDFYASILFPLLPLIVAKLSLSLALAGSLVSSYSIARSLVQPLFGLISDRLRKRIFVFWGPLFSAFFIGLIGWSPGYLSLAVFLFLAGLGISAFHPQATAVVGEETGQRRALGISIFVFGGALGFAMGPMTITWWVSLYGLGHVFVVGIPGIIAVLLCGRFVTYSNRLTDGHRGGGRLLNDLKTFLRPLALLFTVVVATSVIRVGIASFMPLLLTGQGFSLPEVGLFLSACALLGSAGTVAGAMAADRWGRKRVMFFSMMVSVPLFQYYFIHPGRIGLILVIIGSAAMTSPYSLIVAIGQEAIPHRSGTVSALLMGFGWGIAGLIMTPMGIIAQNQGLSETLRWSAYLPLVAASAILLLPGQSLKPNRV